MLSLSCSLFLSLSPGKARSPNPIRESKKKDDRTGRVLLWWYLWHRQIGWEEVKKGGRDEIGGRMIGGSEKDESWRRHRQSGSTKIKELKRDRGKDQRLKGWLLHYLIPTSAVSCPQMSNKRTKQRLRHVSFEGALFGIKRKSHLFSFVIILSFVSPYAESWAVGRWIGPTNSVVL